MDKGTNLVASLENDNYCLITDENGVELYNEKGHLLVCKRESTDWKSVPNIEVVRKLYNLPVDDGQTNIEVECDLNAINVYGEEITETEGSSSNIVDKANNTFIWQGQRTQRCEDATQALIEIFRSPKYQSLMNDKATVKLKVWEKIACELQDLGFGVAKNIREAGLKTFQKWRNLERTYWKYLKSPDMVGENRRKKPAFFDAMHAILTKHHKHPRRNGGNNVNNEVTKEVGMEQECSESCKRCSQWDQPYSSDGRRLKIGEISPETVKAFLNLISTNKYYDLFNGNGKKTKIWESIHDDLLSEGFDIPGPTKRERSLRLFQKWRNLKKTFINYYMRLDKDEKKKPSHYSLLHKIIFKQIEDKPIERLEPTNPLDYLELPHNDHDYDVGEGSSSASQSMYTLSSVDSVKHLQVSPEAALNPTSIPVVLAMSTAQAPTGLTMSTPVALPALTTNTNPQIHPRFHNSSKSSEVLQQIKALHETAMIVQQQNFAKIISLLEEQSKNQQTLNSLFKEYVTNHRKSSKHRSSKNRFSPEQNGFIEPPSY